MSYKFFSGQLDDLKQVGELTCLASRLVFGCDDVKMDDRDEWMDLMSIIEQALFDVRSSVLARRELQGGEGLTITRSELDEVRRIADLAGLFGALLIGSKQPMIANDKEWAALMATIRQRLYAVIGSVVEIFDLESAARELAKGGINPADGVQPSTPDTLQAIARETARWVDQAIAAGKLHPAYRQAMIDSGQKIPVNELAKLLDALPSAPAPHGFGGFGRPSGWPQNRTEQHEIEERQSVGTQVASATFGASWARISWPSCSASGARLRMPAISAHQEKAAAAVRCAHVTGGNMVRGSAGKQLDTAEAAK